MYAAPPARLARRTARSNPPANALSAPNRGAGIKVIGALSAGVGFIVLAGAILTRAVSWPPIAYVLIGLSTVLCLVGWPDARLGLVANAVILLLIVTGVRGGWL
jgi:hypothetical protein